MTALDTSVCIPALLSWHEHHDACRRPAATARVPAHTVIESYSVMTRLPAPHRLDGRTAQALLRGRFGPADTLTAPAPLQRRLVAVVAALGIEGGAIYDALIGLTAAEHGEVLLTRDRRAVRTYDQLDIAYELIDA